MRSLIVLEPSCTCETRSLITPGFLTMANVKRSDAEDTQYVYAWRLEQEAALRATKGTGMTDERVVKFVNGCEYMAQRV